MEVVGLNFSSATTPELLLKTFDHYCEYRKTPNGIILSPRQVYGNCFFDRTSAGEFPNVIDCVDSWVNGWYSSAMKLIYRTWTNMVPSE